MARPVIGITVTKYNAPAREGTIQAPRLSVPVAYTDAIEEAGGVPMLLPRSRDPEVVASALARVDGLLLSGGGDMSATVLGVDPHPSISLVDAVRDEMEIEAIGIAMERGIPILGLCRGLQVLAVACGGTLIQDIASGIANPVQHRTIQSEPGPSHTIEVEEGSLLSRIVGATRLAVNSTHHQAVDRPGRGMRVTARASDGVVEAIEADDGRPILAVQSHPERCFREVPEFAAIFRWFVKEAANHRAGGM